MKCIFVVAMLPQDASDATLEDEEQCQCFKKRGLHFIHLNSRSLLPKMDELRLLVTRTNAAVIGVTETWLDGSVEDSEVEIPGYIIQRNDRRGTGGGVCIYVRSDLAFNPHPDLSMTDTETVWVEILLPKTRPILTGVCYRPPKQMGFYERLEKACEGGNSFITCETVLLGDFNTNIIKSDNMLVNALTNFLQLCGQKQLINVPPRVTDTCVSILDLIMVTDPDNICQFGVLNVGLSDHLITYCTRKVKKVSN